MIPFFNNFRDKISALHRIEGEITRNRVHLMQRKNVIIRSGEL